METHLKGGKVRISKIPDRIAQLRKMYNVAIVYENRNINLLHVTEGGKLRAGKNDRRGC